MPRYDKIRTLGSSVIKDTDRCFNLVLAYHTLWATVNAIRYTGSKNGCK